MTEMVFGQGRKTFDIAFIGDSLFNGSSGGTESTSRGGPRERLIALIQARLGPNIQVRAVGWQRNGGFGNNQWIGASGQRIDELLADPYALKQIEAFKPNAIFGLMGMNDMTQLNSGVWPESVALSQENYDDMCSLIRAGAPNAIFFSGTITPNTNAAVDTLIDQWNAAQIVTLAARSDAALIKRVELNAAIKAVPSWNTVLMNDATHENAAGNVILADTFYASFITVF